MPIPRLPILTALLSLGSVVLSAQAPSGFGALQPCENRITLGKPAPAPLTLAAPVQPQASDFNGDGHADLLWRNKASGMVYLMQLNGPSVVGGGIVWTEPDAQWQIVATADLDGDGKADLVWRNATSGMVYGMLLSGATVKGGGIIHTEPDLMWRLVQVGDLDGDGKADLIWRNQFTGMVYGQLLDGTTIKGGGIIHTEPDRNWELIGCKDFDGDGTTDLVWRNLATGMIYGMPVVAGASQPGGVIWNEPDSAWQIVASGDYDGDGKEDLTWWNRDSGMVFQQLLNGPAPKSGAVVWTEPDTQWMIVGRTPGYQVQVVPVYLAADPTVYSNKVEWSRDDSTIAFCGGASGGGWDVYTVPAVWGSSPTKVTGWNNDHWEYGGRTPGYLGNGQMLYWAGVFPSESTYQIMAAAPGQANNSPLPSRAHQYASGDVGSTWSPEYMTFSADGTKATIGWNNGANLLDWTAGPAPVSAGFPDVTECVISREGTHLGYVKNTGQVAILNLGTSVETVLENGGTLSWGLGGKLGYVAGSFYKVYDLGTGQTQAFQIPTTFWLQNAALSWDGKRVAFRIFQEMGMGTGVAVGRLIYF